MVGVVMFMVMIAVMFVSMLMMVIAVVIVAMCMMMIATMVVFMLIMCHVIRLPVQQHHGVNAVNTAPLIAAELQLPAGKPQLAKLPAQGIGVYPQIN